MVNSYLRLMDKQHIAPRDHFSCACRDRVVARRGSKNWGKNGILFSNCTPTCSASNGTWSGDVLENLWIIVAADVLKTHVSDG